MTTELQPVDAAFSGVQRRSQAAFADWMRLVEPALWRYLGSFAPSVDVEAIVQEALLRMWVLAPELELDGERASLRFVLRLARNLALDEARRRRLLHLVPPEVIEQEPGLPVLDNPGIDERLRAAVARCLERLPRRPRQALVARLEAWREGGDTDDRSLAGAVRMTINTFHKNLSRARHKMAECLARHGYRLRGLTP